MKFAETRDYIVRYYQAGMRRTIYLQGPPAIGKTACIGAAADILRRDIHGFFVNSWPLPVIDPLDLGGLPAVLDNGNGPYAARLPFEDIIPTSGAGIILIDDLPTAPPLTQASAYRLIWEREIGKARLSDDVLIIATGNRDQDRAATNPIPKPLVSKMGWIDFEPDPDAWLLEMALKDRSPIVRAYIQNNPLAFVNFDPLIPGPYASARPWESVAELFDAWHPDFPPFEAFKGWIGEAAAIPFDAFASMATKIVSPQTIFAAPATAPVPEDPGALWVVTSNLATQVRPTTMDAFVTYLFRLTEDYAVFAMKSAIAIEDGRHARMSPEDSKRTRRIAQTGAFGRFTAKYNDLLMN